MTRIDGRKRRPTLIELEALIAVADSGSFNGAAAQLSCTQSRISHAIGQLEKIMGARLLDRSRRGSVATPLGLQVIAKSREMLSAADDIRQVGRTCRPVAGTVRLATYPGVAAHLSPALAEQLKKVHPAIELEILDDCFERVDVERRIRAGRAQIGIAHLPIGSGLYVHRFAEDDYVVVTKRTSTPSRRFFWEDVQREPFIEFRCSGARAILEKCRADGMQSGQSRTFSSVATVVSHIEKGNGFSILPRLAVEPLSSNLVATALPIDAVRILALIAEKRNFNSAERAVMQVIGRLKEPLAPISHWLRIL